MNLEQIIRDYISGVLHLSLATSSENRPWVCEVHFAYDEDLNLYFRSLPSRRHSQELTANPRVAGNIVKQHTLTDAPLGVYFEGSAKQLPAGEERQKAYECIKERLQASVEVLEEARDPSGHQFYKIIVDTFYVFGRLGEEPTQKYALPWPKNSHENT